MGYVPNDIYNAIYQQLTIYLTLARIEYFFQPEYLIRKYESEKRVEHTHTCPTLPKLSAQK